MKLDLAKYKEELSSELENILSYWKNFTVDEVNGGFVGKIDNDNNIDYTAPKGSVLNARILWSFSSAYNLNGNSDDLAIADRAFNYIINHFIDDEFGGVYWLLNAKGNPIDIKKQIYAIAFTIYAFSEYFIASKNEFAKERAIELYKNLVANSYDIERGGYFEAFSRAWKPLDDLRLSNKDANEKKTMNTHLHVLEAFTTLYKIWPNEHLRRKIMELLQNFTSHIINKETGNLVLFFDENWVPKSDIISYGHNIEAAWLLLEAAEAVHDEASIETIKLISMKMASVSKQGLDADGSLWYEDEPSNNHIVKEKHWWVQAEAMVGFFNAWQISKNDEFLEISLKNWSFVKDRIISYDEGEWFWGITEAGEIMPNEDKVGVWKCPYHNSRACMELIKRIDLYL
ncbi:N-acyl-D-glucosamine 2-epimerase [Pedobacter yonginense]|uniref:Cellobiose 2-epimerase n=1 Tax=Pedobacter yonginense TaxID=651869 RepID=A0A317EHV5_9SPHI|nr:AGE family epimerase/isomerase [Pedobacter yonginense]PWS26232.1 N-acyl-D-glucosamine 2-epimerase [Pedobacter yonginense]